MTEQQDTTPTASVNLEIDAMRAVGEALSKLPADDARVRVLTWAANHFGISPLGSAVQPKRFTETSRLASIEVAEDGEIPGVAKMTPSGLELTVRDLKARSTNDAAIRIAHVVIYAHEKLTGEKTVSSRKVLTPILKTWRAYDGNTRVALAGHKGIHRDGDNLSLDAIARKDAEKFVSEILDDSIEGTWNPKGRAAKRGKKEKGTEKEQVSD